MKSDLQYYYEKRFPSDVRFSSLNQAHRRQMEDTLGFVLWQVNQDLKKLRRYFKIRLRLTHANLQFNKFIYNLLSWKK